MPNPNCDGTEGGKPWTSDVEGVKANGVTTRGSEFTYLNPSSSCVHPNYNRSSWCKRAGTTLRQTQPSNLPQKQQVADVRKNIKAFPYREKHFTASLPCFCASGCLSVMLFISKTGLRCHLFSPSHLVLVLCHSRRCLSGADAGVSKPIL